MTAATKSPFGTISDYLSEYAVEMADRVEEGASALFDPERDPFSPDVLNLMTNPGNFDPPKAAQLVRIEAVTGLLRSMHCADLTGEQGSGKTPMACWIVKVLEGRLGRPLRVVITAPNHLVGKWQTHFKKIIPGCNARIVRAVGDLVHLRRAGKPVVTEIYIIGRDRGKLSYAWAPAAIRRARTLTVKTDSGKYVRVPTEVFLCPRCGTKQIYLDKKKNVVDAGLEYFGDAQGRPSTRRVCCGKRTVLKSTSRDSAGNVIGEWVEVPCEEQLWGAYNGTNGRRFACAPRGPGRWVPVATNPNRLPRPGTSPRRMSPAEFIWRYNIRFDVYVPDEVHELSGEGSLQGRMYGWLAARSKRVVNATGTTTGGYASNMLYRLWRTVPGRLRADGLTYGEDGHTEFVRRYGVLQRTETYVQEAGESAADLCMGKGKCIARRERALPGISPLLFARHMIQQSVYLRLLELYSDLPPFAETVEVVNMTVEQADMLQKMNDQFKQHSQAQRTKNLPCRAWSAARAVLLRWPDRPWPAHTVFDRDEYGDQVVAFDVPELPKSADYPKEKRLVQLILSQLERGRKSWVFTEMTGRWDVTPRLVAMLAKNGVRATVLRTSKDGGPKPEDREDWIAKHAPAFDIVISNPGLVKTGLDLYDFPTLIFYYCGDSTYTLRQASRRAWRLGQLKDCEVYYLVYGKADYSLENSRRLVLGEPPMPDNLKNQYTCIQSASLSLMANKMRASLSFEGEFSDEGLAAMAESADMASALAKVIAGKLQVEDPRTAFAAYRKRLEALMPSIVAGARTTGSAAPGQLVEAPTPQPSPASLPPTPRPQRSVVHAAASTPEPVPQRAAPAPSRKAQKALTGLLALAELLGRDDPSMGQKLAQDIDALRRFAR